MASLRRARLPSWHLTIDIRTGARVPFCSDASLPAFYQGKGAQVGCCRQNKDLQNLTKVHCDGAPSEPWQQKRGALLFLQSGHKGCTWGYSPIVWIYAHYSVIRISKPLFLVLFSFFFLSFLFLLFKLIKVRFPLNPSGCLLTTVVLRYGF